MRIRVIQVRDLARARRIARSLRRLADGRTDLPVLRPSAWGGYLPGLPYQAKAHLFILYPRDGELRGWDLARAAVDVLEARRGLVLDWACGYRASGAVWLLVRPWAADAATGKRVWFAPAPGDLEALRRALATLKNAPHGRGRGR